MLYLQFKALGKSLFVCGQLPKLPKSQDLSLFLAPSVLYLKASLKKGLKHLEFVIASSSIVCLSGKGSERYRVKAERTLPKTSQLRPDRPLNYSINTLCVEIRTGRSNEKSSGIF